MDTGDKRFRGQSGTCSLHGPINGVGVLEQPTFRKLSFGWLVKLRQLGEGPKVLPWYLGPRESVICYLLFHSFTGNR